MSAVNFLKPASHRHIHFVARRTLYGFCRKAPTAPMQSEPLGRTQQTVNCRSYKIA
jgi:hypothetical protein